LDDYTDLSKILERYDCDNKQIKGGCYYFIDETQLFRVKHVLSYLEANRQVDSSCFFLIIFILIFSRLHHLFHHIQKKILHLKIDLIKFK